MQLRIISPSDRDLYPLRSSQEDPGPWNRSRETTGGDRRQIGNARVAAVAAMIARMTIMVVRKFEGGEDAAGDIWQRSHHDA